MKRGAVMPHLVALIVAAASIVLVTAPPPNTSENACLDITHVSSKCEESERAYTIYTQCRLKRPTVSLMGVDDAAQECREFARMYMMARHYNEKLSNAEFCSTMRSYSGSSFATDSRIMSHGSCTAGVSEILASNEVGEAAEMACQRIHPKQSERASACQKYVLALKEAPLDGFVDSGRICDKMLTGSNGTHSLDEEHFVYSCVQYASNVIADVPHDATSGQSEKAALEVQKSCQGHLSASEKDFCKGYADLVRQRASRTELTQFCDAQYRKMHKAKAANTRTAVTTSEEAAEAPAAKVEEAPHAKAQEADKRAAKADEAVAEPAKESPTAKAQAQSFRIANARAPAVSATIVIAAPQPIPKPKLPPAVAVAAPEPPPKPQPSALPLAALHSKPKLKVPDMMGMCEHTIAKVQGIGLTGEVFEAATAEVCMNNLLATPTKQPKLRIQRGCRFFAKHLVDAQSHGPVNAALFCAGLSKPAVAHPVSVPVAQFALDHKLVNVVASKPQEISPEAQERVEVAPKASPPQEFAPVTAMPQGVSPPALHVVAKPKLRSAASEEAQEHAVPLEEHEKHHVQATPTNNPPVQQIKHTSTVANRRRVATAMGSKTAIDVVAEGEKSDEDFLNGFLDKFDSSEAVAKQKHVDEVQRKVGELFGEDAAEPKAHSAAMLAVEQTKSVAYATQRADTPSAAVAPAVPPAQLAPLTTPDASAAKKDVAQKAASDDFLSSFLDNYDDKAAPAKASNLAPQAEVAQKVQTTPANVLLTDAPALSDGAAATVAAQSPAVVQPASASSPEALISASADASAPSTPAGAAAGGSSGDIDSLVSSFLGKPS